MLAIATLVTWLIAGAAGIYMFGTWRFHGGPGHQRARGDGLPPGVIFSHLGFGALGLLAWVSYVVTGWDWLAWTGVGLLMPGIGLGICTVTVWGPYPAPPPVVGGMLAAPPENAIGGSLTDEALALALASDAHASRLVSEALAGLPAGPVPVRRSRRHLEPLVPAGHGIAAFATFVLAVVTAIGAR